MQVHKQIRFHRDRLEMSQEDVAEEIYVSRQSISNWERGKNYPDLHSLIALSKLFDISLDQLVKGDLEIMKERIEEVNRLDFKKVSIIFTILLIGMLCLAPIFVKMWGWNGSIVWVIMYLFVLLYSLKVEKLKKKYDIQTYKEISSFMDGEKLDSINRNRRANHMYKNVFGFVIALFIGFIFAYGGLTLLDILFK